VWTDVNNHYPARLAAEREKVELLVFDTVLAQLNI